MFTVYALGRQRQFALSRGVLGTYTPENMFPKMFPKTLGQGAREPWDTEAASSLQQPAGHCRPLH